MYRVLKPGGRLVVLELSRPLYWGLRHGYQVYFKYVLPRIGGLISGDAGAYQYLHKSVMDFPERDRFEMLMVRQGFVQTGYRDLSLGIATIYWGDKAQ
jgi:demethylmenaquinone methyltransferase/2-methoxy-6-polyprenyl-1,4-benzoquinol methylase